MSKLKITGIVLAGGKSSRMGYDKGLAKVGERKMIELVIQSLKKVCDEIIIISNTNAYNYLDIPVYVDLIKDCGPIGGIFTGLFHSQSDRNLIVACDMPFVSDKLLNTIIDNCENTKIVIPSINGQLEPLCGYYHKDIILKLKSFIDLNEYSVHKIIKHFAYKAIPFDSNSILLTNVNTPDELNKIQ
jgi:molybdopterin-guanine dinucleotide biosynthesis protein A